METLSRIRKVGGSLMVTIPKNVVEEQGLAEDELVHMIVKKAKKSGFGLYKLGKFTKEDKFKGQLE